MEYNEYDYRCESEEILRHIKSLDIPTCPVGRNDPLRDELLEELEEARLNEDQEMYGFDFVRELRKVMSK